MSPDMAPPFGGPYHLRRQDPAQIDRGSRSDDAKRLRPRDGRLVQE